MGGSAGFKAQLVAAAGPGSGAAVPHLERSWALETSPLTLRENEAPAALLSHHLLAKDGQCPGASQREQGMYLHWQLEHPHFLPPELTLYICVSTKNVSAVESGVFTCMTMREIIISTFFCLFQFIRREQHTTSVFKCQGYGRAQYDSVVSGQIKAGPTVP